MTEQAKVGWFLYGTECLVKNIGKPCARIEGIGDEWITARYVRTQSLLFLEFRDHADLLRFLHNFATMEEGI